MASDATYAGDIYIKQGSSELVVESAGLLTLEGSLTSTGTITNSGTFTSTGKVVLGPVAAATTTANLPAGGVSLVTATSAGGAQVFTMDRPVVGQHKMVSCTTANSSDLCTVIGPSTTTLFGLSPGLPKLRFVASGTVHLVGYTTDAWHFVPVSTAIAYATTAA